MCTCLEGEVVGWVGVGGVSRAALIKKKGVGGEVL